MATTREATNSPRPLKLRNFEDTAAALFNIVERTINVVLLPPAARTAVATALSSLNNGGDPQAPENWAELLGAVNAIIDCVEANSSQIERLKLLASAKPYLTGLVDDIATQESTYQVDRGLFIVQSQVTDLRYLASCFDQCVAENKTLTVEP